MSGTYRKTEASPPASRMPFNSASAWFINVSDLKSHDGGVLGVTSTPPPQLRTYHLLDVAVHGVVHNRNLGRHLEGIGVSNTKTEVQLHRDEAVEEDKTRRGSSPTYITA